MKLKLLSSNSKLKKDGIFNFDIPAYKSSTGLITCPHARDCIANCYARQGTYVFSNVRAKHEKNLSATLQDDFCEEMIADIITSKADIIRIHSSGDFYSREYISKWFKIMEALPHVQFYAYTKSFKMFEGEAFPLNFKMIQSQGGIHEIDESKPHAKVWENKDMIPENYVKAIDSDMPAVTGHNVALVYHGTKKHNGNSFINKKAV